LLARILCIATDHNQVYKIAGFILNIVRNLTTNLMVILMVFSLVSCGGGSSGQGNGGGGGEEIAPTPDPAPTPIQDQNLNLSSAEPGVNVGTARLTRFSAVDLNAQRLLARTTVNVAAGGETLSATARAFAQFTARSTDASLLADIDWSGNLLSSVNLSASTEMVVNLRVHEVNPNGSLGPEVFGRQLERDGIGSGLKAVEVLNVNDNIRQAYQLNLKQGQAYRVVVELQCSIRVDGLSLALTDCNAESGGRGVFVNELMIMY